MTVFSFYFSMSKPTSVCKCELKKFTYQAKKKKKVIVFVPMQNTVYLLNVFVHLYNKILKCLLSAKTGWSTTKTEVIQTSLVSTPVKSGEKQGQLIRKLQHKIMENIEERLNQRLFGRIKSLTQIWTIHLITKSNGGMASFPQF